MEERKLIVSSSPHVHSKMSTSAIMWNVSIALIPAALWGIYAFGFRALLVMLVSIVSAVGAEWALLRISKDASVKDGSAFLTGLLIGMNMPVDVAIVVPIIASAFAIFVVKWTFGGLGANWMNPALAGRVFVFFSFTGLMNTYRLPRTLVNAGIDATSSATVLTQIKMSISDKVAPLMSSTQILGSTNYPSTIFAQKMSSITHINEYTIDAFFGNIAGCIGEVSAFMLIIGGIYLLIKKIITWHIPVSFLLSFSVFAFVFGGFRNGMGLFSGDFVLQVFSGGMILGALFMATDMVTSPVTRKGMLIYGASIGFFTFLLRYFGSLPESVSLAILLVNIFVPTIDRYVMPTRFGEVIKEAKKKKEVKA